jgi:hypothetical protein
MFIFTTQNTVRLNWEQDSFIFQTILKRLSLILKARAEQVFTSTVKPVYNGHHWDLKKETVWQRRLIKLRFRLAVDDSNWPLLTGGRCSQLVVKSGLTVRFYNYVFTSTFLQACFYKDVLISTFLQACFYKFIFLQVSIFFYKQIVP